MSPHDEQSDRRVLGRLGPLQYLTIAVGCMIGIGWVTVLGNWLQSAGPLGAVLGFLVGGVVMVGVAACYAELTSVMPGAGGDVVFAFRVFGPGTAYLVGWFLILIAVSVVSFEALSFVWVTETLVPVFGSAPLYMFLGTTVTLPQVLIGLAIIGILYGLNRIGMGASSRVQDVLTTLKIAIMCVFVCTAVILGHPERILRAAAPGYDTGVRASGVLWLLATCAFWLGGFQVISQASGERRSTTSLRTIGWITTGSVLIGVLFYCGVVIAATSAASIPSIVGAKLPAAFAAKAVFRSQWGVIAVLGAGLFGILATLNAMMISGSRIAVGMGNLGLLPRQFSLLDGRAVPVRPLSLVALLAAAGVVAGRGLLIPVVNMASMSLILSYVLVCAAVIRLRRIRPDARRPFRVPGGMPVLMTLAMTIGAMAVFIVLQPAFEQRRLPIEWVLFGAWAVVGFGIWLVRRKVICTITSSELP
ncbi:MAG TPA: APC family permease [Steroidobacteraceae bacterium]|nr:APC family permease [Steroidobacteraceae bacterium]